MQGAELEILINGQTVDFTLEDEENLGQVFDALQEWCQKNDLLIRAATLEGRRISKETRTQWESVPVAEVERLEITAQLPADARLTDLENMLARLKAIRESMSNRDRGRLEELLGGQSSMLYTLERLLRPIPATPVAQAYTELKQLLTGSTADVVLTWPSSVTDKAHDLFEQMTAELTDRFEELNDPASALERTASEVESLNAEIDRLSVMFQTGEDRKAMDFIIRLSDLSQKILRILAQMEAGADISLESTTIDEKPAREFFGGLNAVLRELLEAFDGRDTVLIADLLEYEVGPRLARLTSFVGGLNRDGE